MNFQEMQQKYFLYLGRPVDAEILDWERQAARDDLNAAVDRIIALCKPYLWVHMREWTLSVVAGTSTYALDAACEMPVEFWTADTRARPIPFIDPRMGDMNGLRNTNAQSTYTHTFVWTPATQTAEKSGAAGATAGASLSAAGTTVTKSGGTAWASTDVGKIIRLNGSVDLVISSYTSANSIEVARAYIGRLTGSGVANSPSGLTQVAWEVTPIGTYQIQAIPTPQTTESVLYRGVWRHQRLMNNSDTLLLPERYHMLPVYKAAIDSRVQRSIPIGELGGIYSELASELKAENRDALATSVRLSYESMVTRASHTRPYPRDMDLGRGGF